MKSRKGGDAHVVVEGKGRPARVLCAALVEEGAAGVDGVEDDDGRAEEARVDDVTWWLVSACTTRAGVG